MLDYLIVGQGIAGSASALELMFRNRSILAIDAGIKNSSSALAAGIVNPITGRRLVKSWNIDELLPTAKRFYQKAEGLLNASFLQETKVLRVFLNNGERNDFTSKSADPQMKHYLSSEAADLPIGVLGDFGSGWIQPALRLKTPNYLSLLRTHLLQNKNLRAEAFDFTQFESNKSSLNYAGIEAKRIIFCEGKKVLENPFFQELPFSPAKGEFLIIETDECSFSHLIKKGIMLVPLEKANHYWVGATFDHHFIDEEKTEKGRTYLVEKLEKAIGNSYKILAQKVGVRPATKDRRPMIGCYSKDERIALFNGLGSKGVSLSPFLAKNLIDHLEEGKALLSEVNLQRFNKSD